MTIFILCSTRTSVRGLGEAADKAIISLRLLGAHPGGRLVEEQEARLGGERHRDLQGALLAVREFARQAVLGGAEADRAEQRLGPLRQPGEPAARPQKIAKRDPPGLRRPCARSRAP